MLKGSRNFISLSILAVTVFGAVTMIETESISFGGLFLILLGFIAAASPRQVSEWERAVLLRLGKFDRILEPGIVWIVPGVDAIAKMVDMRIRATPFSAEKTLTKDTVPVNVDAVLFWIVTDSKRAVLEVQEYMETISWAAQTTLRDVIGRTELVRMISDRETLDSELQATIDAKTSEWGITVQSVEIRDVRIPASLEDAMSRKAQADREKEARII
ncbi:MAG: SPFH domain-containing protein, partial [Planctomycetota bacterium]